MDLKGFLLKIRRLIIILVHAAIIAGMYISAFYMRFDFQVPKEYFSLITTTIPVLLAVKLIVFYKFNLFSGLWKYVSMEDVWQILKANIAATVVFILYIVFLRGLLGFPRSIFIFDWVLCVGAISGVRFVSRGFREKFKPIKYQKREKVLIVGAGEAGILVLKELKKNMNYNIVGFIDDNPSKKNMTMHGKRVLGGKEDIKDRVAEFGIQQIILAMPSQKGETIRGIIPYCQVPDVKLQIVPGMYKILSGELEVSLREVKPEDLLGRETVEIDQSEVSAYVKDRVVLITGAAGSIGSEISRQVAGFMPRKIILVDYNENDLYFLKREFEGRKHNSDYIFLPMDIKEVSVVKHVFTQYRPDIVFHAAAFKHVPLMEGNAAAAFHNNVLSSRNLIYAADHYGVERFIYISSDKAVNPTNVMGATKRMSEMIMQAKNFKSKTKYMAVRFGNVLGSKGSVIPLFKRQIEENRKVTITHPDAQRYFMSVHEAVRLVLQAGALGDGGEVFILDMGEQIKIKELAENLILLSGLTPEQDVRIEYIGLRPGEKLYEEVLHDEERDQSTKHEKIFIAQPGEFDSNNLNKQINVVMRHVKLMDNGEIVKKLKEIVTTYS